MDPLADNTNQTNDNQGLKTQTPDPIFMPAQPPVQQTESNMAVPPPEQNNNEVASQQIMSPPANVVTAIEFSSNPFVAFGKGYGAALLNNPLPTLTIGFILAAIFLIGYFGFLFIFALFAALNPILGAIVAIVSVLVAIWIAAYFCIKIINILVHSPEEKFTYSELSRYKKPGATFNLIISSILGYIAVFFGFIFFIIPGIILAARFSLMPYVIAVEGLGPINALKRSWQLTKSNTWNMIGANFTDSLFPGNSFLIAGYFAAKANRYRELVALEKANQINKNTHWLNYVMAIFPALIILGIISVLVLTTIASIGNLANEAKNTSGSGDFQINNTIPSDQNSYCYQDDLPASNSNTTECVDKEKCKTIEACSTYYGSYLN